jgi:hypothetical protein
MNQNYAIVENGVVTNIVVWDGGEDWTPPVDSTAMPVPADTFVSIGYTYNGTTFSAPVTQA